MSFQCPTTMADALLNAVVKEVKAGQKDETRRVDHQSGKGNWIARRILISAETRPHLGIKTVYDQRPKKEHVSE